MLWKLKVKHVNTGAKFLEKEDGDFFYFASDSERDALSSKSVYRLFNERVAFTVQATGISFVLNSVFIAGIIVDVKTKNGGKAFFELELI